jgi:hypothetical protein
MAGQCPGRTIKNAHEDLSELTVNVSIKLGRRAERMFWENER